jgi:lipopolysaccharide/colanic/teichoic acid biosynthesis glycosyltransferase
MTAVVNGVRGPARTSAAEPADPSLAEDSATRSSPHPEEAAFPVFTPGQRVYLRVKRTLDALTAACALVVLAPVLGVVWILVRVTLGRPALFVQERVTLGGRRFRLRKFRTMRHADPARGRITDEQRLTAAGRLLRASSLDELPSLWNILVGDMSLVGPRPLPTRYLPLYSPEQHLRHSVRAGLTGLAQVRGRNNVPWDERLELDQRYVLLLGPVLDARIFLRTFATVLSREGVTEADHATSTDFAGPLRSPRLRLEPVGLPVRVLRAAAGHDAAGGHGVATGHGAAAGYGAAADRGAAAAPRAFAPEEVWIALTPEDRAVALCGLRLDAGDEARLSLRPLPPWDEALVGEALVLLVSRARTRGATRALLRPDPADPYAEALTAVLVRAGFTHDSIARHGLLADIGCTDAPHTPIHAKEARS